MFILSNRNAGLLQYACSPLLHFDHTGKVPNIRLELEELVPHLEAVPGLQGAGSEDSLKENPGVVVFVQVREVVEVGQDEFCAGAELPEAKVKYPETNNTSAKINTPQLRGSNLKATFLSLLL